MIRSPRTYPISQLGHLLPVGVPRRGAEAGPWPPGRSAAGAGPGGLSPPAVQLQEPLLDLLSAGSEDGERLAGAGQRGRGRAENDWTGIGLQLALYLCGQS